MAGTHGHLICFLYILFMLDFYSYIFKSIRKMSIALKKQLIAIAH